MQRAQGRLARPRPDRGEIRWTIPAALAVLTLGVIVAMSGLSQNDQTGTGAGREVARSAPATSASSSDEWPLVFLEDFSGTKLDDARWTAEFKAPSRDSSEASCATPDNVSLSDGTAELKATSGAITCPMEAKRDFGGATLRTRGKFSSAHGRFVVRARVAATPGVRATVSLLPQDLVYGDAGRSGELTLLDVDGAKPGTIQGGASWAEPGCGKGCTSESAATTLGDDGDGFHTFELLWSPAKLTWLVDGEEYLTMGEAAPTRWGTAITNSDLAPGQITSALYPAPFDGSNPMYLTLSITVGDDWVRAPGTKSEFPAAFEVDSVRVYAPSAGEAAQGVS